MNIVARNTQEHTQPVIHYKTTLIGQRSPFVVEEWFEGEIKQTKAQQKVG